LDHSAAPQALDAVGTPLGWAALIVFLVAYFAVMAEEWTGLRKSKPVLLAAGLLWALVAWRGIAIGAPEAAHHAFRAVLLEFTELFLFLLVAMTFVNVLTERHVFGALRAWLIQRRFGYRSLYWILGGFAFLLSPWLDNMTTALVLGAVAITVGAGQPRFLSLSCVSIVVAANASGAFSPFGDVTTLMVWQAGVLPFTSFFALFGPACVNWGVPAAFMALAVPRGAPPPLSAEAPLKVGARRVMGLFAATLVITVGAHQVLHLPPVFGMMFGLGLLKLFGFYLNRLETKFDTAPVDAPLGAEPSAGNGGAFNIFDQIAAVEWDTLLFFYGVILAVGALAALGFLEVAALGLYGDVGATLANIGIGILSAVIDNIPIMYAVLQMQPAMDAGQWLLVTLTAGVGGSLLSIGSAAGVALMGTSRGAYTFMGHLRWTWAVALGYAASIAVHLWLNAALFDGAVVRY
jgi:Na+/H+ antiporter NhaD/arsenite permease-like protein